MHTALIHVIAYADIEGMLNHRTKPDGMTPLVMAVRGGHAPLVSYLETMGAARAKEVSCELNGHTLAQVWIGLDMTRRFPCPLCTRQAPV